MSKLYLKTLFIIFFTLNAYALEECNWNSKIGVPCLTISKTTNTSKYNSQGLSKEVFTKEDIVKSGAKDILDVLKKVTGLDYYQSGPKGQQAAIFMRGSESNHSLMLLNGIAINDQSVTNGMAEFGQDFVNTIQQIEVFKGASGAHFGPDAIGGAINFITDVDYVNSYSINGFSFQNNSISNNYTKITDNGWHLNFKGSSNFYKTESARTHSHEADGTRNFQVNVNGNKWLNDNLKFKSTIYYRNNKTDYDMAATTRQNSVTADNAMYVIQAGLERNSQNSFDNLILHYHNYDRKYFVEGKKDKYYSETITAKGEKEIVLNKKFSLGYGSEYKYDWANFETKSYSSQAKGHVSNLGIFANIGFKPNSKQILSFHTRNDHHKLTDSNQTYKFNYLQFMGPLKLGITHSTGLKNPGLYEFYGSSSWHTGSESVDPEKSETNELSGEYEYSNSIRFSSVAYKTKITNRISNGKNVVGDTKQEGLESKVTFKDEDQSISLVSHFAKSRTTTGGPNSRRPDLSYGIDYLKKFNFYKFGPIELNLSHRFIGDHLDWTGSKNSFVKSVDLVDMSLRKDWFGNVLSLNFTNLLNERYEKPGTYSQEGRQVSFGLRRLY